jgi:hypothetical protein
MKPHFSFKGLNPGAFKLWVTTGFNLYSPTEAAEHPLDLPLGLCVHQRLQVAAAQVEFQSKGLTPGDHFITGSRVETRRFQGTRVDTDVHA